MFYKLSTMGVQKVVFWARVWELFHFGIKMYAYSNSLLDLLSFVILVCLEITFARSTTSNSIQLVLYAGKNFPLKLLKFIIL